MLKSATHVQICSLKSAQISGTKHIRNSLFICMNNTYADPNTALE